MLLIENKVEGIPWLKSVSRTNKILFIVISFLINLFAYFSLAVRDLSNLVKPEDIITSEHLVTLLAIVPKYSQKDWLSSYETLTSYVVRIIFLVLDSNLNCGPEITICSRLVIAVFFKFLKQLNTLFDFSSL